jgi:hypothetical protein
MIPLTPVQSSCIRSIGYEPAKRILAVEFLDHRLYHYFDVEGSIAEKFFKADSKGTFYAHQIKERGYDYKRIR